MNIKMKIQDYELPDHQLQWAIKHGFEWAGIVTPTFEMFFDWVEWRWGIDVHISKETLDGHEAYVYTRSYDLDGIRNCRCIKAISPTTKRSARIAACEAIIKYVEENKL